MTRRHELRATQPLPADQEQRIEREQALREAAHRPSTMRPGSTNPHFFNGSSVLWRPHRKRWVTVTAWICFIILPGLIALASFVSMLRNFLR